MVSSHTWAAAAALAAIGQRCRRKLNHQAHCWEDREAAAALVRDMQTLLMVAALRCRAVHIDISAEYDGFVTAQKASIDQADLVIKQHFAQAGGAQTDYDHFATSLANGFGDDETTEATCAEASAMAHEASAMTPAALGPMAMAKVFPAMLPGAHCAAPTGGVPLAVATLAASAKPEALPPMIARRAPAGRAAGDVARRRGRGDDRHGALRGLSGGRRSAENEPFDAACCRPSLTLLICVGIACRDTASR